MPATTMTEVLLKAKYESKPTSLLLNIQTDLPSKPKPLVSIFINDLTKYTVFISFLVIIICNVYARDVPDVVSLSIRYNMSVYKLIKYKTVLSREMTMQRMNKYHALQLSNPKVTD